MQLPVILAESMCKSMFLVETRIKAVLSWLSTQPEPAMIVRTQLVDRSEERRVGKEC